MYFSAHVQDNIGIQSNGLQQVSLSRFTSGHSEHEDANLDVEHDTVIHDDNADVDNTNDEVSHHL